MSAVLTDAVTDPPGIEELTCPACFSEDLEPVFDGETTNFLCHGCWRCWRIELGWAQRVNPLRCNGCQHRAECLSRVAFG